MSNMIIQNSPEHNLVDLKTLRLRPITVDDVISEANKSYDVGRKHGIEERIEAEKNNISIFKQEILSLKGERLTLIAARDSAENKIDRIKALLDEIEGELDVVGEPGESVQIGRLQVVDEVRAILREYPFIPDELTGKA